MATVAQSIPVVTLVEPFPVVRAFELWRWINEFPERNLDDYSAKTPGEFYKGMIERVATERTWGVEKDGDLIGFVGYHPYNKHYGMLHGICFARRAWGRETTETAVRQVLSQLFREGVRKISAVYFVDNPKIRRFLLDLGFVQEGYLFRNTTRNGIPVDMRLVALFAEDFNADRI